MMREPLWFGFCSSLAIAGASCYLQMWAPAVIMAFVCGCYVGAMHERRPHR